MSATTSPSTSTGEPHGPVALHDAVIRFAGDSGDGMQPTGDRFTTEAGLAGNDLVTFPDYPAEIRAPAGTQAGVSVTDAPSVTAQLSTRSANRATTSTIFPRRRFSERPQCGRRPGC